MLKACLAALAACAAPAAAAQPQPGLPDHAAAPALDPAHHAAARRFVALIMPPGAMQRMLGGSSGLGFGGMETMLETRIGDMGPLAEVDETVDPDLTFGEFMATRDQHFRERMRITSEVADRVAGEMFGEIEPEFREAMVEMYGRRFTRTELEEMNSFFETRTGRKFAEVALTVMHDPAFQRIMQAMMPRILAMGQRIVQETATATAHLPPPPQDENEVGGDGETATD